MLLSLVQVLGGQQNIKQQAAFRPLEVANGLLLSVMPVSRAYFVYACNGGWYVGLSISVRQLAADKESTQKSSLPYGLGFSASLVFWLDPYVYSFFLFLTAMLSGQRLDHDCEFLEYHSISSVQGEKRTVGGVSAIPFLMPLVLSTSSCVRHGARSAFTQFLWDSFALSRHEGCPSDSESRLRLG